MRQRAPDLVLFVLLGGLAVAGGLAPGRVLGEGYDVDATLWVFWWFAHAVGEGTSPLSTELMFFPTGHSLFREMGGNFLDTFVAAPFVAVFGATDWQPWFAWLLLVLNGLSFGVLARQELGDGWPARVAAAAWVLNPYALHELAYGRLSQACLVFAPLALAAFLRIRPAVEQGGAAWKPAAAAGAFTALHAIVYWFHGHFLALAFGVLAVVELVRARQRARVLGFMLLGGVVAGLAVSPAVLAMASQAHAVPGLDSGSAFSLTVPPAALDNGIPFDQGWLGMERLGAPMLLTIGWGVPTLIWLVRGPRRRAWLPVLLVSLAFALGPRVELSGQRFVMPHYLAAWHLLPFFERFWHPYRLLSVALVPAALAIGSLVRGRARPVGLGVIVALVIATALEQRQTGLFPIVSREVRPPAVVTWLGEQEGAVVNLPLDRSDTTFVWQIFHHRPTFGGRLDSAEVHWPPEQLALRREHRAVAALDTVLRGEPAPSMPDAAEQLVALGFRFVLLDRSAIPAMGPPGTPPPTHLGFVQQLTNLLGDADAVEGPLVLWALDGDVPPQGIAATPQSLSAAYEVEDRTHPAEARHRP